MCINIIIKPWTQITQISTHAFSEWDSEAQVSLFSLNCFNVKSLSSEYISALDLI